MTHDEIEKLRREEPDLFDHEVNLRVLGGEPMFPVDWDEENKHGSYRFASPPGTVRLRRYKCATDPAADYAVLKLANEKWAFCERDQTRAFAFMRALRHIWDERCPGDGRVYRDMAYEPGDYSAAALYVLAARPAEPAPGDGRDNLEK